MPLCGQFDVTKYQCRYGVPFADGLAHFNATFDTTENRLVMNDNFTYVNSRLVYFQALIDGGWTPNGGYALANAGTKDQIYEVVTDTETALFLNTETYTPDANFRVDVTAGRAKLLSRTPNQGTVLNLPSWFTSHSAYDAGFFGLVQVIQNGDEYTTSLSNPDLFWAEAVKDVMALWLVENPGIEPKTYYVDPTVAGPGTGTYADPYSSISTALAQSDCARVLLRAIRGYDTDDVFETSRTVVMETYWKPGDTYERAMLGAIYKQADLLVNQQTETNVWSVRHSGAGTLRGFMRHRNPDADGFPKQPILVETYQECVDTPDSVYWDDSGGDNTLLYFHYSGGTPTFGSEESGATHAVGRATTNRTLINTSSDNVKLAIRNIHFFPGDVFTGGQTQHLNRVWMLNCRASHALNSPSSSSSPGNALNVLTSEVLAHSYHLRYQGSDSYYIRNSSRVILIDFRSDSIGESRSGTGHQAISLHENSLILQVNSKFAVTRSRDSRAAWGQFLTINGTTTAMLLGVTLSGDAQTLRTVHGYGSWTSGTVFVAGLKGGTACATDTLSVEMDSATANLRFDLSNMPILVTAIVGDNPERVYIGT